MSTVNLTKKILQNAQLGTYVMSHPQSVGAADLEVSLHQIGAGRVVRVLRPANFKLSQSGHPVFAHQVTFLSKFRRNAGSFRIS